MSMGLLDRFRSTESNDENVYDEPKERTETKTMDRVYSFTEYKVVIDYGDRTRTEYVTKYSIKENHIELYECEPRLYEYHSYSRNKPSDRYPRIKTRDGDPLVISLANAEDVDIEKDADWVFVAEDVEYEQVYRQYKEGGEWQESHKQLSDDFDPDEYDIRQWYLSEWEAASED